MHLTILSWFLISSLCVNLLIWLRPCIWPFYLAFSFLACMWTCWFHCDHAADHSILVSHFQLVCELVDLTLTMHLTIPFWFLISSLYVNLLISLSPCIWPFYLAFSCLECMWTCWFDSDHASDHCVLLSHFQDVCELVYLTLTMHLTILFYFLMSSLYVNLLIWLWACIWPFCLAFSFPGSMWTCWCDSYHASDHSVLLFHVQLVPELVDLTLTMHLTILSCFLISSLCVNLLIWLWPCIWPFYLAFSFLACMWTCWFNSDCASEHSILVSHFQLVCELVDLTLTMHLTISCWFLISSLYVNLLISLSPCIWPFYLAFSCLECMWTCWCDCDHASDHSVLLSHV